MECVSAKGTAVRKISKRVFVMECKWVIYFGDYCFTTDCGHYQGRDVRPKQKTCFCGKRVKRFVQDSSGVCGEVKRVQIHKGRAYYFS